MKTITLHDLLDNILGPLINKADWISISYFDSDYDRFVELRSALEDTYRKYSEMETKLPGDGE